MSNIRNTLPGARQLTARSVLLSLLLGTDPPRLPVARLVRGAGLFGIAPGTARTALSRMAASGELHAEDGWYRIASDRLLTRQARQRASRQADTLPWDGLGWRQAVVTASAPRAASDRADLRTSLRHARFGELREGVWLRPDNLPGDDGPPADRELSWFRAEPTGDPVALAGRLWDLVTWREHAEILRRATAELTGPLERGDAWPLADGFVVSAAVLRHLQADPLLPDELLPRGWPGSELRRSYDRFDAAYRRVLAAWLRSSPATGAG